MYWRFFTLVLCQASAAGFAWLLAPKGQALQWTLGMALLGGYLWVVLDSVRGVRLLRWLRDGAVADLALGNGLWGEASDRVRRMLRASSRLTVESESRLKDFLAALQASPNGVVLLDAEARIEWFNQTAADHFGFDVRRDLLQHFGNLVRDPSFAAYLNQRDFLHGINMPGRDSSNAKPVTLSVNLHAYGEGRLLLLSRDITAVEQAEAMRRDFVANVSHEIRTPLTVLAGFVETLQTLPLDDQERQRYLGLMSQQATRMQTLVVDLLTLSRLEGSPLPSTHEWVSVDVLMQQCEQDARDLSHLLLSESHDLVFERVQGCEIAGSALELHSAMSNLIGNAIRYTPAQRRIEVGFNALADGGALFFVKDQGPGIAQEHIPRLTERFYRVDRSRSRETGGTGLGLAIVKHVAQRHGAELTIESQPGKGSTFSLTFPPQRVRSALQVPSLH
ncbi:phosphate regulon sensor histidine kinase PhoR [Rhodoferax sp. AJA081-3]|uniref:phosphate regulon sensor histidine kinase PhoR n=1 Tax=Rhodoferax sp. AJA081-3 TaxID=2752316 RepID=UPI001ADEC3A1|nr:phosphate regulon sensor histidine kinase PhoR [Rhodoferax sp. AJA081-3]